MQDFKDNLIDLIVLFREHPLGLAYEDSVLMTARDLCSCGVDLNTGECKCSGRI